MSSLIERKKYELFLHYFHPNPQYAIDYFKLSRLAGKFSKKTIIQIRVVSSGIELISNGITKKIETNTNGEADITLPVVLLKSYLKDGAGV